MSSIRQRALITAAASVLGGPAFAAGIDSRNYTCADLQHLIAAQGFTFISRPVFGDSSLPVLTTAVAGRCCNCAVCRRSIIPNAP
jgi:hypothetical protein